MELIDELSKGVSDKSSKFDSKAFSLASDAVEAKVKAFTGQSGGQAKNQNPRFKGTTGPIAFVKASDPGPSTSKQDVIDLTESPPHRKRPAEGSVNGRNPKVIRSSAQEYKQPHRPTQPWSHDSQHFQPPPQHSQPWSQEERSNNRLFSFETKRALNEVKEIVDSGPFGKVVVFKSTVRDEGPVSIIERAASAAHMTTSYGISQNHELYSCKFSMDGMYLATGEGKTQKIAKEAACGIALDRLKETSFTVLVKAPFVEGEKVDRDLQRTSNDTAPQRAHIDTPIAESNIGNKLMKLMGWTGGGLGRDEQGIAEPVKIQEREVRRGGLGITNFHDFRKKVTRIIEDYAHSDNKQDLVFTPDFTKDERRTIHELVRKYNLKSRSYGKNEDQRHLVVFRKVQPLEIVQDLLVCGGETEKYKLISPIPMTR
ncbi:NF-kappa-B-repressing factor isoform X2 [Halyomorpha halys]|nr:NF-kappa-B-repressing factor isoform X2 [Halyomorpha halys]